VPNRILILGVGNILLADEGLGVRAVERLNRRFRLPEGIEAVDGGVLGLDLLPLLDGVTHLVLIDAVRSGHAPGTQVRLEGRDIPSVASLKQSMHEVGVQELLAVLTLQGALPEQVVLLGMEPESLEWGAGLSDTVAARLDALLGSVIGELDNWGVTVGDAREDDGQPMPTDFEPAGG
jgi:hydrogenase maturation protease